MEKLELCVLICIVFSRLRITSNIAQLRNSNESSSTKIPIRILTVSANTTFSRIPLYTLGKVMVKPSWFGSSKTHLVTYNVNSSSKCYRNLSCGRQIVQIHINTDGLVLCTLSRSSSLTHRALAAFFSCCRFVKQLWASLMSIGQLCCTFERSQSPHIWCCWGHPRTF